MPNAGFLSGMDMSVCWLSKSNGFSREKCGQGALSNDVGRWSIGFSKGKISLDKGEIGDGGWRGGWGTGRDQ